MLIVYQLTSISHAQDQQDPVNLTVSLGMPRQMLEIKFCFCFFTATAINSCNRFHARLPSLKKILSLPPSRLLADLWAYRFFLLWKPPWNFTEVEFRPDHSAIPPLFTSFYFLRFSPSSFAILLSVKCYVDTNYTRESRISIDLSVLNC